MVNDHLYNVKEETRCHHYRCNVFRLAARVLLYATSYGQDNTHDGVLLYQSWNTGWKEK